MGKDRKIRKEKGTESLGQGEINMTPMIDVTFQLIIFFLCLKFKTLEGKLSAYLPKEVGQTINPAPPMEKVNLHIYTVAEGRRLPAGNRERVVGHRVKWQLENAVYRDLDMFTAGLRRFRRLKEDPREPGSALPLTVHAHPGVLYADVTMAVDCAQEAGFQTVNFAGGRTH